MADGSLLFDTKIDSSGFSGGLSKIAGTAKKGVKAVSAALIGASAYALKVGSDFESGMSKVAAISGATGKELQALTNKAKEMGAKTKFSATESAEAFQYMAMAGWKTGDMLNGIEGIMNLAAASGENLGQVSDIVTDALTAFGLKASDSAHFADVLAQASSNANTNVGMMGETFKYVAPVAGALGFSAEDCALAIGLMANSGIKAGQAGTALRSILNRMASPTNEVQQAMDALGISITNSDGSMKSLRDIMKDLRSSFSNLTEAQKAQMASALGGQEAMSGLLAIVGASDEDFDKLTDAIDHSDGAAKRMADTMNDNLKGKVTILQSALEALGISAYEKFETPMKDAVDSVTKNVDKLNKSMSSGKLSKSFDKVAESMAKVASTAINLSIKAIPKVVDAFAFIVDNAKKVASGVLGAYTAFKIFTNYQKICATVTKASAAASLIYEVAVKAVTGQITIATAAQEALNLAMMAIPAGLLAAAVAGIGVALVAYTAATIASYQETDKNVIATEKLVSSHDKLTKKLEENKKARQESTQSVEEEATKSEVLTNRLEELAKKTNKTKAEKEELKNIVDQLNKSMPDLNLQYDEETDKLNKDTDAVRRNIDAQKDLMLVKAYQEQQQAIVNDIAKAQTQLNKATEQSTKNEKALEKAKRKTNEAYDEMVKAGKSVQDTTSKETQAYINATLAQAKVQEAHKKSKDTAKELQKQINALNKEYEDTGKSVEKALNDVDVDNALADITQKCAEAGIKIPQSVVDGIKAGKYAIPQSVEEMKALINMDSFEEVSAKAKEKGVQIPQSMAEGLKNGTVTVEEANQYIKDAIKFDDVVQKAKDAGVDIPAGLAENVANGQTAPADAVQQMKNLIQFQDLLNNTSLAGAAVPQSIKDAVMAGRMSPAQAVQQMKKNAVDAAQMESEMKSKGTKGAKGYTSGVGSGKKDAKTSGQSLKDNATSGASGGYSGMHTEGANAGNGFAAGIRSVVSRVASAAANLVRSAINAAKKEQNSHSPSRVWRDEVGEMSSEGYIEGIKRKTKDAQKTARKFIKSAINSAKSANEKIEFDWGMSESSKMGAIQSLRNSAYTVASDFQKAAQSYPGGYGDKKPVVNNTVNYNMHQTNVGNGPIKPSENARELEAMARRMEWRNKK